MITDGKYAGSKGFILSTLPRSDEIHFDQILVVGVRKYPQLYVKTSYFEDVTKETFMKIFLKNLNVKHVRPTRYFFDIYKNPRTKVSQKIQDYVSLVINPSSEKKKIKKEKKIFVLFLKRVLIDQYFTNKAHWFFNKLKF